MRKIYSLVLSALVALPMSLNAQTMTEENETLAGYQDGYRLEKDVDFVGATVNGVAIEPSDKLIFNGQTDYKVNNNLLDKVANKGLEFLSIHTMKNYYSWSAGNPLRTTSNERWITIPDLRENQIFVVDQSGNETQFIVNSNACNGNTGWADTFQDPLILEEISKEIHDLQDLSADRDPETGEVIDSNADKFRYFKVINPGTVYIKVNKNSIYRFQIWSPVGEAEVVSNPLLSIEKVLGDSRSILLTSGTSTAGNEVFTFYNFDAKDDDGNTLDPIAVKEVVDYYVGTDAEGAQVTYTVEQYENDEIPSEVVVEPVTKKVLDAETTFPDWDGESPLTAELYFGDGYLYSGESFNVQMADGVETEWDDQGVATKAVVTVKYVTVSSAGVISEIMSTPVEIEYLKLNAPTLSLVGFSGTLRQYKIGWNNNKKNDENEYTINWTADDDARSGENVAVGDVIAFEHDVTVTVSADGYDDGVLTMEADVAGLELKRKNATDDGEGNYTPLHDWDFQNIADEVKEKIMGTIDHYAVYDDDGNELRTYTVEQKQAYDLWDEEEGTPAPIPEDDAANLKAVKNYYGWGEYDGGKSRNWLAWTGFDAEGNVMVTSKENPATTYEYAKDQSGLLHDLDVDCPHQVYSALAIYTDGGGLYYMSRGTLRVNPVAYGEYVVLTTSGGTQVGKVTDEISGYTFNISSGTYVHNIDIFTYDELPDVPEEMLTGIGGVEAQKAAKSDVIYNIGGQRVNASYKGIVIKNGKKYLQR